MGPGGQFTQFERGNRAPLVPPRILAQGGTHLTPEMMQGAFNRTAALKVPGTRVLRSGNPFMDMLARTVWIDDRGQATVTLRRDPRADGATVYFGFDFLVEADIDAALDLVGRRRDQPQCRCAARRTASSRPSPGASGYRSRARPRSTTRANSTGSTVRTSQARTAETISTSTPSASAPCSTCSAAGSRFAGAARFAEEVARDELERVTDLTTRCDEARQYATASLTVRRVQAEARQAAGRIVTDTESYATDVAIADALVAGLAKPVIKVISVTCLVRGALPGVDRG